VEATQAALHPLVADMLRHAEVQGSQGEAALEGMR
jgi:hypothetical protein